MDNLNIISAETNITLFDRYKAAKIVRVTIPSRDVTFIANKGDACRLAEEELGFPSNAFFHVINGVGHLWSDYEEYEGGYSADATFHVL